MIQNSMRSKMSPNKSVQIKSRVHTIDVRKARKWLKLNGVNRPISPGIVARYSHDMMSGKWELTGEAITFAGNYERLIDGQHRLAALVKAAEEGNGTGKPNPKVKIQSLVVTGLPESAFMQTGSGKTRTMADVLKINGEQNYAHLAAMLTRLWFFEQSQGALFYDLHVAAGQQRDPTKADLSALLEKHPKLRDSISFVNTLNRASMLIPHTITAVCHYLFSKKDSKKADAFITCLSTGEELSMKDNTRSILLLRRRLYEREKETIHKMVMPAVAYLIFRAWKAYSTNEKLEKLQLPRDGNTELPAI